MVNPVFICIKIDGEQRRAKKVANREETLSS